MNTLSVPAMRAVRVALAYGLVDEDEDIAEACIELLSLLKSTALLFEDLESDDQELIVNRIAECLDSETVFMASQEEAVLNAALWTEDSELFEIAQSYFENLNEVVNFDLEE